MDTRVALLGIMIDDTSEIQTLNEILHEYSSYIIGRMGLPYREKAINIISIAIDAPESVISAISGKIGRLRGITSKVIYSKK